MILEITMYETLLRPHEVTQIPALDPIAQVSEKLKKGEQKREEKRLLQIATGKDNRAAGSYGHGEKRKREEGDLEQESVYHEVLAAGGKKAKIKDDLKDASNPNEPGFVDPQAPNNSTVQVAAQATQSVPITPPVTKISVSKALPEVRGHTSYLTFACLLPLHPALVGDAPSGADTPLT